MPKSSFMVVTAIALTLGTAAAFAAAGPPGHSHAKFSAGEPGNPKNPARIVKVSMREDGKKMLFDPAAIEVKRGEQIRFVLENDGIETHEFVLATRAENKKHGEQMKKFPNMEHDDPNGLRLAPFNNGEILWRFSKRGTFEYACLIPGHFEAGMYGKVLVK